MKGIIIEIKYVGSKISKLGMLKRELVNWKMGHKKITMLKNGETIG